MRSSEKFRVVQVLRINDEEDRRRVLAAAARAGFLACYNPAQGQPLSQVSLKFSDCDPWVVMVVAYDGKWTFARLKDVPLGQRILPFSRVRELRLRKFLGIANRRPMKIPQRKKKVNRLVKIRPLNWKRQAFRAPHQ